PRAHARGLAASFPSPMAPASRPGLVSRPDRKASRRTLALRLSYGTSLVHKTLRNGLVVVLLDGRPVHHVPEVLDVFGAAVLVLEVIGVLPHVQAEDGRVPVHHRVVLVGRADHLEAAVA